MRNYFYKPLILIAIIMMGCEQDEKIKALPAATQEGKNTFGCYVNNAIWLAEDEKVCVFCPLNVGATYDTISGEVRIFAFRKKTDDSSEDISLYAKNVNAVGNFALSIDINNSMTSYTKTPSNDKYLLANKGNLNISKLDTVNRIISGTFSFEASNGNTILAITKGVFDAKY